MLSGLINISLQAAPMVGLSLILAACFRRGFRPAWLATAVALVFVHDFLLTRYFWELHQPAMFGSEWNWLGKLIALAATVGVAALPMFGFARTGITLRQKPGSKPAWILVLILCAAFFGLAIVMGHGRADAQTIAYQWTMPGLEEETFFRGVLLLALDQAFVGRRNVLGADLGWGALLSSTLFGSAHGIAFAHGVPTFTAMAFLTTFLSALILAWVRERTGSLVAPAIGHNVGNGAFTLF